MADEVKTTQEAQEGAAVEEKAEETSSKTKKDEKKTAKKQTKYIRTAKGKRRTKTTVPRGRAYIQASYNNTIVTITDPNGNTIAWATSGSVGFRGPKKATPYAASVLINKIADLLEPYGTKELAVFVTGIGGGRDSAVRSLNSKGFNITSIKELTPVPHNGCRPRRPRRV